MRPVARAVHLGLLRGAAIGDGYAELITEHDKQIAGRDAQIKQLKSELLLALVQVENLKDARVRARNERNSS